MIFYSGKITFFSLRQFVTVEEQRFSIVDNLLRRRNNTFLLPLFVILFATICNSNCVRLLGSCGYEVRLQVAFSFL